MLEFEKKARKSGFSLIIGLDEAGRGPLAGPVVAAAVSLRQFRFKNKIDDSKQLTPRQREKALFEIFQKADVGIGIISEAVIDRCNISNSTYFAMTNAVWQLLGRLPAARAKAAEAVGTLLLVDGKYFRTDLPFPYQTIVDGDALSLSIACASIVAKVTRDRILKIYHNLFPQYGFDIHKGYPTPRHRAAIKSFGPCPIHRRTFSWA